MLVGTWLVDEGRVCCAQKWPACPTEDALNRSASLPSFLLSFLLSFGPVRGERTIGTRDIMPLSLHH